MAKEEAEKKKPEKKKEEKGKERRPTALKRDDQNEKTRLRNRAFRSSVRTSIRQLDAAIEAGEADQAKARLNETYSLMDRGVQRGIFKLNTARRTKSRLAARVAKTA